MNMIGFALLSVLLAAQSVVGVDVETVVDKKANFAAVHTYSWSPGYDAFNPDIHKTIVAAVDAELAKLGFTKMDSGADVRIAYYAVARVDVDLKALEKMKRENPTGSAPTGAVGRLVVAMRGSASTDPMWSASTREFLDPDPVKLKETIGSVAARLFATYPGRKPVARK